MSHAIPDVDALREEALAMTKARMGCTLQLAPGVFDLGDEGIVFGGNDHNRESFCGLSILGEGSGIITPTGRVFAPTAVLYSGNGAAIDIRGVRDGVIADFAISAPNGAGVRLAAKSSTSTIAGRIDLKRLWVQSDVGVDLVGLDEREGHHGDGQVDLVSLERVELRGCVVGLRQNSRNTIATDVWRCNIVCQRLGIEALEGTIHVRNTAFGNLPSALAAFYAHRAEDISIDDSHFECDTGQCIVIDDEDNGRWTQARLMGNRITYGVEGGLGVEVRRQRGALLLAQNLYGMRGIRSWRIGVYSDPERFVVTELGPRLANVALERVAA